MISHKYRFHGHGSLKYLYRNGKTVRTRLLALRYVPNRQRVHNRLAIVVGKKVIKSAVKRNRIRRRLYEAFRREWDRTVPGYDIVCTVFVPDFVVMPAAEVDKAIVELLRQAELYDQPYQRTPISDTLEDTL